MTSKPQRELQISHSDDIEDVADAPGDIAEIAALLNGKEAPAPEQEIEPEPQGESPPVAEEAPDSEPEEIPEKAAKPKDLNDLAEKLEMEVKDIYKITVPDADGESHTIGELKDKMAEESDFSRRELELSERKVTHDNEMLRAKQQLDIVLKSLPAGTLNQSVLDQANAQLNAYLDEETTKLLRAVPEWSEPTVKEADLEAMAEYMGEYGFGRAELDRMIDHRFLKFIRDNMQRAERWKNSLLDVEEVKKLPKGQKASRKRPANKKIKRVPHTEKEKDAAIAQLFTKE